MDRPHRPVARGATAGLVALSLLVGASVGRCELPQPKFPTLGSMDARAWVAGSSIASLASPELRGGPVAAS